MLLCVKHRGFELLIARPLGLQQLLDRLSLLQVPREWHLPARPTVRKRRHPARRRHDRLLQYDHPVSLSLILYTIPSCATTHLTHTVPYSAQNGKMTAFKPGFRMIAGDPLLKKNTNKASICHRCLGNGEGFAPCDSKDTAELPLKYCPKGIRATVIFPSCWDGKNLDSPVSSNQICPRREQ